MYVHQEKLKLAVVLLIHVFKNSACSNNMSYTKGQKASGKNTERAVYTTDMNKYLMQLERESYRFEHSQKFLQKQRWQVIHTAFKQKFPNYPGTQHALHTRCLREHRTREAEEEAADKTVQPYFFPELGEAVLSAPSICPYQAIPPSPATSVSAHFDSDTDIECDSDGLDALPDLDDLPESRVVFRVSTRMLRASVMGSMDVIDDQEERIQEDEPEYVPHKKPKVTIRYNSSVSPPQSPPQSPTAFLNI
jgi:hypothetical protein